MTPKPRRTPRRRCSGCWSCRARRRRTDLSPVATSPRAHRDPTFLAAKRARLDEPHLTSLRELAAQVRRDTGALVPDADPDSGGTAAQVLLVLETPSRAGTFGSGMISLDNDDATAANLWRAVAAADLPRQLVLVWNAVPWYVGEPDRISSARVRDIDRGVPWLVALAERLPQLRAVVALGRAAQRGVTGMGAALTVRGIVVLTAPHPSQRVLNRPGGRARAQIQEALAAARLTAWGSPPD